MSNSSFSETSPLIPNGTSTSTRDSESSCITATQLPSKFEHPATGIWSRCSEGTRIYFTILISSCLISASDPPYRASLTALYKDFLCCQQNEAKCYDRNWCDGENAKASERELSMLFQWQSLVNAGGGFVSISLWYWLIWPYFQRHQPPNQKDMTRPFILGLFGYLILMLLNVVVACEASRNAISADAFRACVLLAPAVSFMIGGGVRTSWAFRENIIAAVITPPRGDADRSTATEGFENTCKPFRLSNRQTAFILSATSGALTQLISGITMRFVPNNSGSTAVQFYCLLGSLACASIGFAILLNLPSVPLPSLTNTEPPTPRDPQSSNGTQSTSVQRKAFTNRDRVIIGLVLLSGIAISPLYSSVASNFAVLYISQRMDFNTNKAVFLTSIANIFPPLIPILVPRVLRLLSARSKNPPESDRPDDCPDWSTSTSPASHTSSTSTTDSTSSSLSPPSPSPGVQSPNQVVNQAPDHENPNRANSDIQSRASVKGGQIVTPLIFLGIATIGTGMMSIPSNIELTQAYPFVLTAITCISIGGCYQLFTEPILGRWSAEGEKPVVFVIQQLINTVFLSLGAWLLNHGFQWEAGGDDGGRGGIGWTYLGIMVVCVAAAGFLICAAWVSRDR